jgi:hypothetical protein
MKKGLKILIGILLLIGIGIGGFAYMQHKEHEKMVTIATSQEARKVYEDYFKQLDSEALTAQGKIRTYEINENDLEYNPMGGLSVLIVINEDKQLYVRLLIIESSETGSYEISGSVKSASFVNLLKN